MGGMGERIQAITLAYVTFFFALVALVRAKQEKT